MLTEQEIQTLESVANTLRGMTMDRRIPADAIRVMRSLVCEVDAITDRLNEADYEDDEPDPDLLREDRDERARLAKEAPK